MTLEQAGRKNAETIADYFTRAALILLKNRLLKMLPQLRKMSPTMSTRVNYQSYITSPEWQSLAKEQLYL